MRTKELSCPSGLIGVARAFKLKEEEFLADKKLNRAGGAITKLLNACWMETKDFGPYPKGDRFLWSSALASDRMFLFIQLRILTLGPEYEFRIKCKGCPKMFAWKMDLNELDVDPCSETVKNFVRTGTGIPFVLSDGRSGQWKPLTGDDESALNSTDSLEADKDTSRVIAQRLINVENTTTKIELIKLAEDLEIEDVDMLLDTFEKEEGGVDLLFDVVCPACGTVQQVSLPFEASFYSKRQRFVHTTRRRG